MFVLILVIALLALVGYIYYRKKKAGSNPTFTSTQDAAKLAERQEHRDSVNAQRKQRRNSMKKQREERRGKYEQNRDEKRRKKEEDK